MSVIPDYVVSFDIYRNSTAYKVLDNSGKKLENPLSSSEITNIYAIRLDRQTNKTYISYKGFNSRIDNIKVQLEDENEQPIIKDYCAEHIRVTRFFIIVSCPSFDNYRGIIFLYMRPGLYTSMNGIPYVG